MNEIIIYESADGKVQLDVSLANDSIWINQQQMSELFGTKRQAITKHLKNIFTSQELDEKAVCSIMAHTATDGKSYKTKFYSLDAVISVGYRVNSKEATQFRIWATSILTDHVLKGYTLNQQRLTEKGVVELEQSVQLLQKALLNNELVTDLGKETIALIVNYSKTWHLLLAYDEDNVLRLEQGHKPETMIPYELVTKAIATFKHELMQKSEATELFGREREHSLQGILGNIEQTFDGEALYKTVEERAANLLYFVIKDHPFSDGNKRIGSFLFLLYLQQQALPLNLNDSGLVALALLIAESAPPQKELMIRLIMNLIGD
jgi:DNA ligase (NAD+)